MTHYSVKYIIKRRNYRQTNCNLCLGTHKHSPIAILTATVPANYWLPHKIGNHWRHSFPFARIHTGSNFQNCSQLLIGKLWPCIATAVNEEIRACVAAHLQ